jgi:hypothetical protein
MTPLSPEKGALDNERGDSMITLAQRWIEEGPQRGIREGVRMAKDLPELKALIVDIEKVQ